MCENSFNIISGDLPKFPKRSFLFVVVVCSLVHNAIRLFALGAMGFACRLYLSHYPLRFITSNSLFALASTIRKTKRLSRRQVPILIFLTIHIRHISKVSRWPLHKADKEQDALFCHNLYCAAQTTYCSYRLFWLLESRSFAKSVRWLTKLQSWTARWKAADS